MNNPRTIFTLYKQSHGNTDAWDTFSTLEDALAEVADCAPLNWDDWYIEVSIRQIIFSKEQSI